MSGILKKCMKFQEFKKNYEKENLSIDDLVTKFVETYENKLDDENNEENEILEGKRKKYENKYMPPLPGVGGNNKKIIINNKNNDINNNDDSDINDINNNINLNTDDIYNEENKKYYEKKEIKNEGKKSENNDINNNTNNINEIKEETSFNLSENTD